MKKLAALALLALVACQPDNRNLEKQLQEISKKLDTIDKHVGQGGGAGAAAGQGRGQQRPEPDRAKTYAVPVDNDPFDGPADALITVVKAYDYACPFCERVRDTMTQLHQKYGNQLRVVYKQFVVHPQVATAGALAFCAAAKQNKGPEMDALLWDKGFKAHNYDKDIPGEAGQPPTKCWDAPGGCPVVLGFAGELQLDTNRFKQDMKACQGVMTKDMRDLQQLGVAATPSFFINGRFISGAVPLENFTQVIDEELAKANDRVKSGTPPAQYYQQWVIDKGLKTLEAPKQ
jgi:protein-disulfide isomerase